MGWWKKAWYWIIPSVVGGFTLLWRVFRRKPKDPIVTAPAISQEDVDRESARIDDATKLDIETTNTAIREELRIAREKIYSSDD